MKGKQPLKFSRAYWIQWGMERNMTRETMVEWCKGRRPRWVCPECGHESNSNLPLRDALPYVCMWFPKCPGIMIPKVESKEGYVIGQRAKV